VANNKGAKTMNELQAVGTDPLRSNQLVLSQQEIYVGQELHVDSPWWSSMILFLAIGLGGFILWAALFEIDQSVRASGQIIPTARNQIVQVVDGGVLAELFIEEGDEVTQGQKLAVLEKERAQASFEEGRAQVAALRIALIRAQAEANRLEPQYRGEDLEFTAFVEARLELYHQKKRALQDTLGLLGSNLDLARRQLDINEQLFASQDVSSLDVMDAQARVSEAQNNFIDAENRYLREALEESATLETELAIARQQTKERLDIFSHTDVRAPVAGVVKYLSVNTLGGVMRPGDELMQISPTESELVVEVRIEPVDVGQLELGLPVDISLDAFDATIYGKLEGELIYLSSDTLTEKAADGSTLTYYRARARVNPNAEEANPKFADLQLRPGMTATVDIRTAKRTVLQFIAKPILRAFSGALSQR
jgi:adhesin transport system membrane fusion protein